MGILVIISSAIRVNQPNRKAVLTSAWGVYVCSRLLWVGRM